MMLIFDECMPRKWMAKLGELTSARKQPVSTQHLLDFLAPGTPDDKVIGELAKKSNHIVFVSGDTARQTREGNPRLPSICPDFGIRSVFLTPSMCQLDGFEKVRSLLYCFPKLLDVFTAQPGSRFKIHRSPKVQGYDLKPWPIEPRSSSRR